MQHRGGSDLQPILVPTMFLFQIFSFPFFFFVLSKAYMALLDYYVEMEKNKILASDSATVVQQA